MTAQVVSHGGKGEKIAIRKFKNKTATTSGRTTVSR